MNKTHGLYNEPLYGTWVKLIRRCTNPRASNYHRYGGRGITICDVWRNDFVAFSRFVTNLPHYGETGYTIDRIDNSIGYEPGNVRWATFTEQNRNRRSNHLLTYNGETRCLMEWSEKTGIGVTTIAMRIRHGWSVERTLTEPVQHRKRQVIKGDA